MIIEEIWEDFHRHQAIISLMELLISRNQLAHITLPKQKPNHKTTQSTPINPHIQLNNTPQSPNQHSPQIPITM